MLTALAGIGSKAALPWQADLYHELLSRVLDPKTLEPERARTRALMRDVVGGRPVIVDPDEPERWPLFGDLIREALQHRIEGPLED